MAFGNHQANIETAIYYKCIRNVEMMARTLGYAADETRYRAWAERIYGVYNAHLLVTSKTTHPYAFYTSLDNAPVRDCTMVAQAVALHFALVPAEHIEDVTRAFLDDCADRRIRAGEIGLKLLWNTLADLDRPDIVLAMARREEHPSYMRFLRRGETTLLEFWQDECRSKCHDMLGTIYEWCYEAVLGLRVVEDGYRRWTVRPPIGSEFGRVQGSVDCLYGKIEILFENSAADKTARLRLRVPMGTVGTVLLAAPGMVVEVLREGWREEEKKRMEGPAVDLDHGTYEVEIFL
ncbi:hypothetical protein VTI74DRAFT_10779 [Chaetomium olivicolor]